MNKIAELIQELCPNGVPYQPLGDLADLNWGDTNTTKQSFAMDIDGFTAYSASGPDGILPYFDYDCEAVVISAIGALAGKTWYAEGKWSCIKNTIRFFSLDESIVTTKFLYWYTSTDGFWPRRGSAQPFISKGDADKILIAVPPVQIQDHIVRVLDAFTELEDELEAELEARRKQYHFYRDSLLTFPEMEGVRWVPMGEVTQVSRGASPRPIQKFLVDELAGTPWIKIGDVKPDSKYLVSTSQFVSEEGAVHSRRIAPGDFILTNSMSFGRPYISKIHGCVHDGWLVISDYSDHFNSDFLYHLLGSEFVQKEFRRRVGDGSIQNLNAEIVRSVLLPVPSLELQKEIAESLDQFDLLVSDIQVGLPAEISARRKQYEYYRDKLLTFKELAA